MKSFYTISNFLIKLGFFYITSLVLISCGKLSDESKADISSNCTLNGGGDYKCTFTNKGDKDGSVCEHFVLERNKSNPKATFVSELSLNSDEMKNLLEGSIYLRKSSIKADEMLKGSDKGYDPNKSQDIKADMFIYAGTNKIDVSDEVCSGIVKAGDIRQIEGSLRFISGLNPFTNCKTSDSNESWTDACNFRTTNSEEIFKTVKKIVLNQDIAQ